MKYNIFIFKCIKLNDNYKVKSFFKSFIYRRCFFFMESCIQDPGSGMPDFKGTGCAITISL
jgi:hypothetical protein